MGQLLNSELVFYAKINNKQVPLCNTAGFPEPDTEDNGFSKPLKQGKFDPGGLVSLGPITAQRVFDPDTEEDHKAEMQSLMGGFGTGVGAFHKAPGLVPALTPIKGETYDIVLRKCWLSDGQNSDGDGITMINYEYGVQGVGR